MGPLAALFLFAWLPMATATAAVRPHLSFFAPTGSVEALPKLALPWALMRAQYPLARLQVFVNGPNATQAARICELCARLERCRCTHFVLRDIYMKREGDRYRHVNGAQGFDDLFAMYRAASEASRTELNVLLQPDCLVRGRVPYDALRACTDDVAAAVCAHKQRVNVMEEHMLRELRQHPSYVPEPTHFSFTCGSIWKKSYAQELFGQNICDILKRGTCKYDDACFGIAVPLANFTTRWSAHIQDWRFGEFDNMAPIIHDDKRHYARGWQALPEGLCPIYDRLRALYVK